MAIGSQALYFEDEAALNFSTRPLIWFLVSKDESPVLFDDWEDTGCAVYGDGSAVDSVVDSACPSHDLCFEDEAVLNFSTWPLIWFLVSKD